MSEHLDDAQRTLERRALRNVRALVDKLEAEDREHSTWGKRLTFAMLVALIGVAIIAFVGTYAYRPVPGSVVVQSSTPPLTVPSMARRKFVGSGKDTPFAAYVDQFSRRVESVANSRYPLTIRGSDGSVQLTAAIRSDGSLERVEINRSSGNPSLDNAAANLVTSAQPFQSFAAYSLADVDVLHITRTFTFETKNRAKGEQ
jgi:protein TonB